MEKAEKKAMKSASKAAKKEAKALKKIAKAQGKAATVSKEGPSPAVRFAEAVRGTLYLLLAASLLLALVLEQQGVIVTLDRIVGSLLVAWIGSHSATDLAKEMGVPFTEGTVGLAEAYLSRFG